MNYKNMIEDIFSSFPDELVKEQAELRGYICEIEDEILSGFDEDSLIEELASRNPEIKEFFLLKGYL